MAEKTVLIIKDHKGHMFNKVNCNFIIIIELVREVAKLWKCKKNITEESGHMFNEVNCNFTIIELVWDLGGCRFMKMPKK